MKSKPREKAKNPMPWPTKPQVLHGLTIYAPASWFERYSRIMQVSPDLAPIAGVFLDAMDYSETFWQVTRGELRRPVGEARWHALQRQKRAKLARGMLPPQKV